VSRGWLGYWHAMSIAVFALCFVLSLRSMAATHSAVPERRVGAWAPPVQARLTAQRVTEEVHGSRCSQERLVGSCSCRSMADKMELWSNENNFAQTRQAKIKTILCFMCEKQQISAPQHQKSGCALSWGAKVDQASSPLCPSVWADLHSISTEKRKPDILSNYPCSRKLRRIH
jgi:hypothetical protein